MKKILLIGLAVLLLSGCGTMKVVKTTNGDGVETCEAEGYTVLQSLTGLDVSACGAGASADGADPKVDELGAALLEALARGLVK